MRKHIEKLNYAKKYASWQLITTFEYAVLAFFCISFLFSYHVSGQEIKNGRVIDSEDATGIHGAHIQNLSQQKFTVSNQEGYFHLPVRAGDSIWISCIGFESIGYVVGKKWMEKEVIRFRMHPDTILLDAVTIYKMPTERQFKRQILDHQPVDTSFRVFGMPENIPLVTEEEFQNDQFNLYSGRSPIGMIYSRFSKKEKEKRKMIEILSEQKDRSIIKEKFNREIVAQITELEGDDLTDFISFCDFKEDFLLNSTQFQIAEAIAAKYKEFIKSRKI